MVPRLTLLIAVAALSGAAAANDIVRCKAPGGGITYQPAPCGEREAESRPRIATAYPEPNRAESQRIFEREAALDRRLEAQRDRLSAEAIARLSRPDPAPPPVAETYAVVWPAWGAHPAAPWPSRPHPHPRNAMRGGVHGRLR